MQEYFVDGHLLLFNKSLYSCSEACVRVDRVVSPPFIVGLAQYFAIRFS